MSWGAVIGGAVSLVGGYMSKKSSDKQTKTAENIAANADPYAQYRGDAAARLNALATGQTDVSTTASYAARLKAAERTMAAQGYTGSGNALVAAADAGAAAYQQEFDNLALLSGVQGGTQTAAAAGENVVQSQQNANATNQNTLGNIGNSITDILGAFNNKNQNNITPVQRQPITSSPNLQLDKLPFSAPGVF